MKKINLSTAVLALFRQELTRTQIARELNITVEEVDQIMGVFIIYDDDIPFLFKVKFPLLISPIKDLELSPRIQNSLEKQNIIYLWQVLIIKKEQLLKIKGFGKSCLSELDIFILKELCEKKINQPLFYDQFPDGLLFNPYQFRELKKHSNKTFWASQSVFFIKKTLHWATSLYIWIIMLQLFVLLLLY